MKTVFKFTALRKSFKREIFAGLIAAAAIPVLITSFLLVNVFKSRLKNDYEKEALQQIEEVSNVFLEYFQKIESTIESIIEEKRIIENIDNNDSWDNNKAYTKLYALTHDVRNKAGFNILDRKGKCVFTTESENYITELPVYWGILKVAYTHPEKMIIKKCVLPEKNEIILQTAKSIFNNEECVGFVVTNIKKSDIEEILSKNFDNSNDISLLDSFYEEIYSSNQNNGQNFASLVRNRIFENQNIMQSDDEITFFLNEIGNTGLILILGKEPVLTEDITDIMWGVIILIGLFSLLFCIFIASLYSDYLTVPVKRMIKTMEKVQKGNLDVKINSKRQDELGLLSEQFDNMTNELKKYMELKVRHQQELNDSNIAMMQAQLNPHFLYNTLDTMKWVAKANNVPTIAKMSSGLAQILRMSISETRFITIKEELELVEKYVEIQQIRFDGNFTYDVELPMELEECIVPKLIVQPIVENALIHGLKEVEKGHIFTNVYQKEKCLFIEVTDNGCGIEEKVIKKLNSRDRKNFKGHIGFYNVDTILKLYYGEDFGIKAKRLEGGGTSVCITLPLQKK